MLESGNDKKELEGEKMYCINCGTQFEGSFCPNCGASKDAGSKPRKLTSRGWFWVLLVLLLAALVMALQAKAGRTGDDSAAAPSKTAEETAQEPESGAVTAQFQSQEQPSIPETVLLDKDGIRVVATGISEEKWFGLEITVAIENNTDRTIAVQVRGVSVNGAMVSPIFSCNVAAGKKANDAIPIYRTVLDKAGILSIQSIELRIRVFDAENWSTILEGEPVAIQTGACEDGTQEFDESGLVALDQNGIRLIVRGEGEQDNVWGKGVEVLIKNDSGRDVTVRLKDISINGYMFEPVFSCDVTDGKLAYSTVFFQSETLDINGIETIETMEFTVLVFDMRTLHSVFESEPVAVTFPF